MLCMQTHRRERQSRGCYECIQRRDLIRYIVATAKDGPGHPRSDRASERERSTYLSGMGMGIGITSMGRVNNTHDLGGSSRPRATLWLSVCLCVCVRVCVCAVCSMYEYGIPSHPVPSHSSADPSWLADRQGGCPGGNGIGSVRFLIGRQVPAARQGLQLYQVCYVCKYVHSGCTM